MDAIVAFATSVLRALAPGADALETVAYLSTTDGNDPDVFVETQRARIGDGTTGLEVTTIVDHDECQGMPRVRVRGMTIVSVGLPEGRRVAFRADEGLVIDGDASTLEACRRRFYEELLRCSPESVAALRALRALHGFDDVLALVPRPAFRIESIARDRDPTRAIAARAAIEALRRADPAHATAPWFLALLAARLGDRERADAQLVASQRDHADAEASIALAAHRLETSPASALEALDAVPESAHSLTFHGLRFDALYRLGRDADAMAGLSAWAARTRHEWGRCLYAIDEALLRMRLSDRMGDRTGALVHWERALSVNRYVATNVMTKERGRLDPWVTRYLDPEWVRAFIADPRCGSLMRTA